MALVGCYNDEPLFSSDRMLNFMDAMMILMFEHTHNWLIRGDLESGLLLLAVSLFAVFTFLFIISSLFIFLRVRRVSFCTVLYTAARRRMFLDGCQVLPFARMITIGLLLLVTCNLLGVSVYFTI